MENIHVKEESECLQQGVLKLPGEPVLVINGVPPLAPTTDIQLSSTIALEKQSKDKGPGIWVEGREVRKMFGDQFYKGEVTQFDSGTGWYRVEYEDGDLEDLEWKELEQVILPLDISIPLKTLALKIVKRTEKPGRGSGAGRKRGGRAN